MNKIKKIIVVSVILIIVLCVVIGVLGYFLYKKNNEVQLVNDNIYNSNLYELVGYVQNVETYLAKSTISKSYNQSAESLTYLWREANLAQTYLSRLPIESQELEKTEKFLNQVSDYSYSLSRECINGKELTYDDFNNLEELHSYSIELEQILNQLYSDLNNKTLSWNDLKGDGENLDESVLVSSEIFSTLEENFHEYSGLIYDGAFSEHLTSTTPKFLNGSDISEEEAKNTIFEFFSDQNPSDIENLGESQNTDIVSYNFKFKTDAEENVYVSISKNTGIIVSFNCNRDINGESIPYDEANLIAQNFLNKHGFSNMKQTYYLNENSILTINYAYTQDDVVIYPDLIKVKVALDNGEILGLETTGFLSNHSHRDIDKNIISLEDAKSKLNENLNIQSEGLAIIPTEYKTEILCYEFKGKINDTDFMVYVNAKTGKEEDVLVVYNTPNGVLTM